MVVEKGELIVKVGEVGEGLYIIWKGEVCRIVNEFLVIKFIVYFFFVDLKKCYVVLCERMLIVR